jgi:hypothetical protein
MIAPVILFVYARADHTRQTIEALKRNVLADQTDLIVYSDAPKTQAKSALVQEVRNYLKTIEGFRSVDVRFRSENFGLAKSIVQGVTQILQDHEAVIVLEDDLQTSPYFLTYMNAALQRFRLDERVACIHGYVYPTREPLPEAFFLPGADCWGWATWRRGWACFESDGQKLLDQLRARRLTRRFDFDGTYPYTQMLKDQIAGKNDSWAIRWYASAFLADKLTLYPGRSLVLNIGNDASGTHCDSTVVYDAALSPIPIDLTGLTVQPDEKARGCFARYFRAIEPTYRNRILNRVRHWVRRVCS